MKGNQENGRERLVGERRGRPTQRGGEEDG